jgi:hypothetical protein
MSPVFRVLEVFRPVQRRGPVLVGETPSVSIAVGTWLVSSVDSTQRLEVIAVDLPTSKSLAEGRLAIVVQPDLGDQLRSGAVFDIVHPER